MSNLTSPTSINQSLVPNANDVFNLGSSSIAWATLYSYILNGGAGGATINLNGGTTSDSSSAISVNWQGRTLVDISGTQASVDYNNRKLIDSTNHPSVDWEARQLVDSASAITLDWSSGGVIFSLLTPSTVPYLNASKALTSSIVTPTELGYLSGVTSSIQAQLNSFSSSLSLSNLLIKASIVLFCIF